MKQKYVYKPYSDFFPEIFLQEKNRLTNALRTECINIEHIGSTSVPQLGGKGIIDIGIAVARNDIENAFRKIESLSYIFRESGSAPERWFFRVDLPDTQEGIRRYHVHLTFPESMEWKKLIAFRDYLRVHPIALKEYSDLKKISVEEANEDGALYRKKKSPFFERILIKALKHKIYFVIGASGSGKTTTLKHFEKTIPPYCTLIHFDNIGVPSFEEMEKEYGSIEEWQRIKTIEWVKKIAQEKLSSSHVIFDAQIRPSFITEACDLHEIDCQIILFDCVDTERKKRLIARGHPELADENMMNWAAFLRRECQKHHHKIINNSHITITQTLQLFNEWLQNQLSKQLDIPIETVTKLISNQFPEYAHLPIKAVEPNGWDNRTFHLGSAMSIRLPSSERYAAKVAIEHKWLPKLAPKLSIPIPKPIATGKLSKDYPWNWSIYGWIEGKSANILTIDDHSMEEIAIQLALFLNELEAIDPTGGPAPGSHNFFRGDSLIVYEAETRSAIDVLEEYIDVVATTSIWETAISSKWNRQPVWIHGDFSSGNILIKDNYLAGVIDFGGMAIGDPACDLVIAWTFLNKKSRERFRSALQLDQDTWNRAKGWALWKALITLEAIKDKTSLKANEQLFIINEVLKD